MAIADSSGCFSVIVVAAIVSAVVAFGIFQANQTHESLLGIARRLNGRYDAGGLLARPGVEFTLAGHPSRLEFQRADENTQACTRLEVTLGDPGPGTLHILPEGFGQSFLKMFGAQDLEIGDARFDADYVIKASPESLAARVFSPERRALVIASVRRLSDFRNPTIDLERYSLRVQIREHCTDEGRLMALVHTAEDFLKYLFGLAVPAADQGIQWGELQTPAGGECPVCGTPMDDLAVRCEACRTAHHLECWEYAGKCSTYACKGKRFTAGPVSGHDRGAAAS